MRGNQQTIVLPNGNIAYLFGVLLGLSITLAHTYTLYPTRVMIAGTLLLACLPQVALKPYLHWNWTLRTQLVEENVHPVRQLYFHFRRGLVLSVVLAYTIGCYCYHSYQP